MRKHNRSDIIAPRVQKKKGGRRVEAGRGVARAKRRSLGSFKSTCSRVLHALAVIGSTVRH